MTKLSVNGTKWSSLLARTRALLFFIFLFKYLISGPKGYPDLRETGPWSEFEKGSRARYAIPILREQNDFFAV